MSQEINLDNHVDRNLYLSALTQISMIMYIAVGGDDSLEKLKYILERWRKSVLRAVDHQYEPAKHLSSIYELLGVHQPDKLDTLANISERADVIINYLTRVAVAYKPEDPEGEKEE